LDFGTVPTMWYVLFSFYFKYTDSIKKKCIGSNENENLESLQHTDEWTDKTNVMHFLIRKAH
jgi:hypothetical protein